MTPKSLYQRLLAVVLLSVIPVFVIHVAVQMFSDVQVASARAESTTQDLAAAAIPLLQNMLIVGDLATTQETLDNIMRRGQFRSLDLVDAHTGVPLAMGHAGNGGEASGVPGWFSSWLDFRFARQHFPIQAGGVIYATLLAEPSTAFLVADIWQRLWTALVLWLATAGCLLLLLRIALRRGLQPMADLAAAVNRFGSGDLSCRAPTCAVPELAATATAFNHMADNLAEAQETLELRVLERTAELVAREAHTSAILRNLHDAVIELDAGGRVLMANAAACRLFGYGEDELPDLDLVTLIPGAAGLDWRSRTAPAAGGGDRRSSRRGRRRDGSEFDVEISLDRFSQECGEAWIAVLRDVSEQKAVEAAREAARINAERLATAKSEFLANMSHEIRTPLGAMLGLAQIGLRKHRDPEVLRMLERFLQSGELLLRVINDILDFSKIEAHKLQIESIHFKLADVIDRAVDIIAPKAYGKGLEFLVDESPRLPAECLGDPVRISQVLMNLLANAVKFTEAGQVRLEVSICGDQVRFRIADTGIGMEPAVLERLFEPFEQADASVSRRFGGTGLGLAISRRLATLMGGDIQVTSEAGKGTVIHVQLPLKTTLPSLEAPRPGAAVVLLGLPKAEEAVIRMALQSSGGSVGLLADDIPPGREADCLVVADAVRAANRADDLRTLLRRSIAVVIVNTPGVEALLPADIATAVRHVDRPVRWRHLLDAGAERRGSEAGQAVQARRRLAGIRVLAAEDDAANRLVLREILEMEGAVVETVAHGAAACERLAAAGPASFDLVITDLQMPGLDGYATATAIQRLAPDLPVVGLSAHAMPEERKRCLAAGMVELIAKPLAIDALVTTLLKIRGAAVSRGDTVPGGPIDWHALESRFSGNAAVVDKLAASFLDSASETCVELRGAVRDRDLARMASLSHRTAGLAANLLVTELAGVARQAEQAAREGLPQAEILVSRSALLLDDLAVALRARVKARA